VIAAIVLAAGASSRLGRPKQLLDLGGRPVVRHVVDAAVASPADEVVVVVGHVGEAVAEAAGSDPKVRIVENLDYSSGQSTSFHAGLDALGPDVEAAVFLLGDQPGIRTEAIAVVVEAFRGGAGPVVQASYGSRPAHPILIAREVWAELQRIGGDEGARAMLRGHPGWVSRVEVGGDRPDDIDTAEDYARVRAAFVRERGPGEEQR